MSVATSQSKKVESTQKQAVSSDDFYSSFQESLQTYFSEARENAANYLQAVSDLQEEIIEARKKNAENIISLQKATYDKFGGEYIPPAVMDLAKSFASKTIQTSNLQNEMILTSLDTLSKNIEAFNKNSAVFENINKKIIDYWASIIKQEAKN